MHRKTHAQAHIIHTIGCSHQKRIRIHIVLPNPQCNSSHHHQPTLINPHTPQKKHNTKKKNSKIPPKILPKSHLSPTSPSNSQRNQKRPKSGTPFQWSTINLAPSDVRLSMQSAVHPSNTSHQTHAVEPIFPCFPSFPIP